ncbi:MAG: hypothetical protein LIO72_09440 [Ruminococcus sp.]|nr:hypothetical protein [Ruminococcus sp.]
MSDNKSTDEFGDKVQAAAALATLVTGAVVGVYKLSKPLIDDVSERAGMVMERRRSLVPIPDLCSADMIYSVGEAVDALSNCGLTSHLVEAKMQEADVKYCECFDGQVILTVPHANKKVEPGTSVEVKYITRAVIDESKRILEEQERKREQLALEKSEKRAERSEKAKQVVSDAIETTKGGVAKIPAAFHKKNQTEDIVEELPEQTKLIEQPEEQSEIEE